MIDGLDHIVLLTGDLAAAEAAYATVLGLAPAWRTRGEGVESVTFMTGNCGLELMAPFGDGQAGARVRARLAEAGEGLASLAFRVGDAEAARRKLERRGMDPEEVASIVSTDRDGGGSLAWRRTRARASFGVRLFFLELDAARPLSRPVAAAPVSGLDHVVVRTPDPDRAAALYGARLGLDMALDRSNPDWGSRLMFFRCGDLIVEIAHDLKAGRGDGPDSLWGLTWRVDDARAAQARLKAAGLDVSDVRRGRKPGTEVFTVRNGTCGAPTLMIAPAR